MTLAHRLALTAVVYFLAGCSKPTMHSARSDLGALPLRSEAQVGVAEVDITPPPGLGLFGHGPESRVAEGTLLRLRCHAFVFVGPGQAGGAAEALAFVPCELPAPSLLLQRRVAELVRQNHPLGSDRIWIAATHTHAGPGHYFASQNYAGPLSSRRIGYDHEVLEFLAQRIAAAVSRAFVTRKVGRWGWATRRVQGLSKNRSYAMLRRNRALPAVLAAQLAEPVADPALNAVDQQLSLLRVEQQDGAQHWQPLAALLVFGLHPTVIDHRTTLYNGDAFGYASRALAERLRQQHGRRVLVAMANGIEGDVTSVRREATPAEARRIGVELANQALPVWDRIGSDPDAPLDAYAAVHSRYRELTLPRAYTKHGCLCERPEVGTPVGGGADDHPTFWRALDAFNPGAKRRHPSTDCHSPKYFILGLGESVPGVTFPKLGPVGVARLGNGLLVTMPAELTTVVGMRIRDSVQGAAAQHAGAPGIVSVVGLSHEYLQYVASAEEYPAQHYEGASTLYGPHTGELLRAQATCLTADLWGATHADCASAADTACQAQEHAINTSVELPYDPGFFQARWLSQVPSRARGQLALSRPSTTHTADGQLALESELSGLAPSDVREPESFELDVLDADQVLDDEQGSNLRVRWDDDRRVWTLSWTPDVAANPALCEREVRFRVRARHKQTDSIGARLRCAGARGKAP
jgi:neutral ceramidase